MISHTADDLLNHEFFSIKDGTVAKTLATVEAELLVPVKVTLGITGGIMGLIKMQQLSAV